ncbi:MAG: glycerol kinase, partial [Bacteroidales bacterium]|nr:glycerol kinase [Bacteroidales bacterium]
MHKIIAIDQSTSGTKLMLFTEDLQMQKRINKAHRQYYPKPGWVEHDAEEIYRNVVDGIRELLAGEPQDLKTSEPDNLSLAITNQRETVVVWNRLTGRPIANAVV